MKITKLLIIISTLIVTFLLALFPLFKFGAVLKQNIALVIVLIVNQNSASNLFIYLISSYTSITVYVFGALLVINCTYLVPLFFIKKPFAKAILDIYMIFITIFLAVSIALIYGFFNFSDFHKIIIEKIWIIPIATIGIDFFFIFLYGLQNLWANPPKLIVIQEKKQRAPSSDWEYLRLKKQIKELKQKLSEMPKTKKS